MKNQRFWIMLGVLFLLGCASTPAPEITVSGEFLYGHCNSDRCVMYYSQADNTVREVTHVKTK